MADPKPPERGGSSVGVSFGFLLAFLALVIGGADILFRYDYITFEINVPVIIIDVLLILCGLMMLKYSFRRWLMLRYKGRWERFI